MEPLSSSSLNIALLRLALAQQLQHNKPAQTIGLSHSAVGPAASPLVAALARATAAATAGTTCASKTTSNLILELAALQASRAVRQHQLEQGKLQMQQQIQHNLSELLLPPACARPMVKVEPLSLDLSNKMVTGALKRKASHLEDPPCSPQSASSSHSDLSEFATQLGAAAASAAASKSAKACKKARRSRGKLCVVEDCDKLARGRGLCKRHGGGRRCNVDGCKNSARGGSQLCTSHGGGRRCQHDGCCKGAEGATFFCVAHGGGKRCSVEGCSKKDQGKGFCKAHGGGKRCGLSSCERSAKAGSDFCTSHFNQTRVLTAGLP